MDSWLAMRSSILDEIVGLDGPGGRRLDICGLCSDDKVPALYRCLECSYSLLYCARCVVKAHKIHPLHRLEVRSFFLA